MPDPTELINAGGVLAFAAFVLWELRTARQEHREATRELVTVLAEIRATLSRLDERSLATARTPPHGVPTWIDPENSIRR